MKRIYFVLCISLGTLCVWGQTAADSLLCNVKMTSNRVFYSPHYPHLDIEVVNALNQSQEAGLKLHVTTDDYQPVCELSQTLSLSSGDSSLVQFQFEVPHPGFYRCTLTQNNAGTERLVKKFNIGYEPTHIVSLSDAQPDLRSFWDETIRELATVAPHYKLTLLKDSCNNQRNTYIVSMKSFGGETIQGYYVTPVKKGKYPAYITYMGYGSKPFCPKASDNPNQVDFILSVRGQALNEATNKYGDWITYGLQSKETYYYRGAFMDLIRGLDFLCSRTEVDTMHVFAQGGSQGGAFTYAASALDHRIKAAAPTIPFLSDYPDYFKIVNWPAQPVKAKQMELKMTDAEMYKVLSYFDIKNLAGWIKCPIFMGVGLQDEVCPNHTNFSGYNRVNTEKDYVIYPLAGHGCPDSLWWTAQAKFFSKYMH